MFVSSTLTAPTKGKTMDEEARYQIHLRNQMEKISEKISKIDQTKANWLIVHPSWFEDDAPDCALRDYLMENSVPISKDIADAIDENFWDLI